MRDSTFASENWHVVANVEGRYSLWPATRPMPAGWDRVAKAEDREACIARIETIWSDMRPGTASGVEIPA